MFAYNLSLVIFIFLGTRHTLRPRGTQSDGEKRGDGNFQARGDEPLGTDSNQTISKRSIECWLLIGTKKMLLQAISNSDYRAHTAPLFSKLEILDIFQVSTLDTAKFLFRYTTIICLHSSSNCLRQTVKSIDMTQE